MNYVELQQKLMELDKNIADTEERLESMMSASPIIVRLQDEIGDLYQERASILSNGKTLAEYDHAKDPNTKTFGEYWGVQVRKKWTIKGNALELLTKFATLLTDTSDYKSRGLLDDAITFNATKVAKLATQHSGLTEFPFDAKETIVTTFNEKAWQKQYDDSDE